MKRFWSTYVAYYRKNIVELWFKAFFMAVLSVIFMLFSSPVIVPVFCVGFIVGDPMWFFILKYNK